MSGDGELKKTYSMKELADMLGVSRATIDRVIHNRGGIGEDTVKKVKELLEQVDYKPNKIGRGLSKKLQKHIYFIYHVAENEFFSEIYSGIQAAMKEIEDYGFTMQIMFVDQDSKQQIELMDRLAKEGADAIVLSPFEPSKFLEVINRTVDQNIPVITFNNDVRGSNRMFYAGTDYYQSGRIAGELLGKSVKSGEIAVFIGEGSYWQVRRRLLGFTDVIRTFPRIQVTKHTVNGPYTENTFQLTRQLIGAGVKGIYPLQTGIRGIVRALKETPDCDVEVVTYDLSTSTVEGLKSGLVTATICQEPFYQGYKPVKVLFDYFFEGRLPDTDRYITKLDIICKENLTNYRRNN
jgi:LacI family transcriptional regulator